MSGISEFMNNTECGHMFLFVTENEIDQETLLILDDQAVKEDLIKPLGPRSKLLQKLKELKVLKFWLCSL